MSDKQIGVILQRDKETYAIVPRTPVGLITPENLTPKSHDHMVA